MLPLSHHVGGMHYFLDTGIGQHYVASVTPWWWYALLQGYRYRTTLLPRSNHDGGMYYFRDRGIANTMLPQSHHGGGIH